MFSLFNGLSGICVSLFLCYPVITAGAKPSQSPRGLYRRISQGTCESHRLLSITTQDHCEKAALLLGLKAKTIAEPVLSTHRPSHCMYSTTSSDEVLHLNGDHVDEVCGYMNDDNKFDCLCMESVSLRQAKKVDKKQRPAGPRGRRRRRSVGPPLDPNIKKVLKDLTGDTGPSANNKVDDIMKKIVKGLEDERKDLKPLPGNPEGNPAPCENCESARRRTVQWPSTTPAPAPKW